MSFILAAYNAESTIEAAVWSIARLNDVNVEILMVDHQATDATLVVARQLGESIAVNWRRTGIPDLRPKGALTPF